MSNIFKKGWKTVLQVIFKQFFDYRILLIFCIIKNQDLFDFVQSIFFELYKKTFSITSQTTTLNYSWTLSFKNNVTTIFLISWVDSNKIYKVVYTIQLKYGMCYHNFIETHISQSCIYLIINRFDTETRSCKM